MFHANQTWTINFLRPPLNSCLRPITRKQTVRDKFRSKNKMSQCFAFPFTCVRNLTSSFLRAWSLGAHLLLTQQEKTSGLETAAWPLLRISYPLSDLTADHHHNNVLKFIHHGCTFSCPFTHWTDGPENIISRERLSNLLSCHPEILKRFILYQDLCF